MPGQVELLRPEVAVRAGGEAEVVVIVVNSGESIEAFEVKLSGAGARYLTLGKKVVEIRAGGTEEVHLRVRVPEDAQPGRVPFVVRVSTREASAAARTEGALEVVGTAELASRIAGEASVARQGTAIMELHNHGLAPARVVLTARGEGMAVTAEPDSLVVEPGATERVRLRLRPDAAPLWHGGDRFTFTVRAESLTGESTEATGEAVQRAVLPAALPWVVVALLVLSGLAAVVASARDDGAEGIETTVTTAPHPDGGSTTTPTSPSSSAPTTLEPPATTAPAAAPSTDPAPVPSRTGAIAFQSDRDGNFEVYVVDPRGQAVNVTNHPAHDGEPAWSPDGTRIAFDSDRDGGPGQFDVYVMNADGTNVVRLTTEPGPDGYPAWSPDGSRIAFVSFRLGNSEIFVMNSDGSGLRRLTRSLADDGRPVWTPDGSRIIFQSNRTGDYELYSMSATDGSGVARITTSPGADLNASVSPDGARVAFESHRDGDPEIYVSGIDGADPVRLTTSAGADIWPVWSPDGSMIAFASARNGSHDIFVMDADGRRPRPVAAGPSVESEPAW